MARVLLFDLSMRSVLVAALIGCGDEDRPMISDAAIDARPLTLDCETYCNEIQANCAGPNAQYASTAQCRATCESFAVGTSTVTDTSGNTLGCRIHHASAPPMVTPAAYCASAGPGGDLITATSPAFCSGGDVCTSFCTLEIKACGSLDAPLPGDPRDADGNHLYQYVNLSNCMRACGGLDKTHIYSTTSAGDSLACRLAHAVRAAVAVIPDGVTHCAATAATATGPCTGAATP
jgi:hypothetical protein